MNTRRRRRTKSRGSACHASLAASVTEPTATVSRATAAAGLEASFRQSLGAPARSPRALATAAEPASLTTADAAVTRRNCRLLVNVPSPPPQQW